MKLGKILMVLCIVAAVSVFVFGITGSGYAKTGPDISDTKDGIKSIEKNMPDNAGIEKDKGSPLHAWKAIVAAGKKAGDVITTQEFEGMRNWSASTRGYELRSLVNIGVLAPTGVKGEYKLLVDATSEQIDQINNGAKPIVNKISKDETKTALGIDTWILDDKHLGEGKVKEIAAVVKNVTGKDVFTPEVVSGDLVMLSKLAETVPASVAINAEIPFTINGLKLSDKGVVADEDVANNPVEQQSLLAALVDTRIVSPEAGMKGDVANFSAVPAQVKMFKDIFVVNEPENFKSQFEELRASGATAVIIAIEKTDNEIKNLLTSEALGLSKEDLNNIVVMRVTKGSASAEAFEILFNDPENKNGIDLRTQKIDKILSDKNLVKGLKGAI